VKRRTFQLSPFVALAALAAQPGTAAACSVCFGEPGTPMSSGLFWGVVSLLGVVGVVLTGIVAFFIHVARRSGGVN
jgi:hypothetical protein